jgi:hypothetical protein
MGFFLRGDWHLSPTTWLWFPHPSTPQCGVAANYSAPPHNLLHLHYVMRGWYLGLRRIKPIEAMLYALFRALWRRSKDTGYRLSCHPIFDLLECHEISIEDDTPAIEANDTDKSFIMKVYPKQRPRRSAKDGVHLVNCFRVDESKSLVAWYTTGTCVTMMDSNLRLTLMSKREGRFGGKALLVPVSF